MKKTKNLKKKKNVFMMTVTQGLWCIRKVQRLTGCLFRRISSSKVHCFQLFTKKWYKGKRLCMALTEEQTLPLCLKHREMLTLALFKEDETRPRSKRLRLHIACRYVLKTNPPIVVDAVRCNLGHNAPDPFSLWSAKVSVVLQSTKQSSPTCLCNH